MHMPSLNPAPGSLVDKITTVVLANLLWFIFAVLIVTLPAATAGLFAVLVPLVRGRDVEIFATFFGTMRRQWAIQSAGFTTSPSEVLPRGGG